MFLINCLCISNTCAHSGCSITQCSMSFLQNQLLDVWQMFTSATAADCMQACGQLATCWQPSENLLRQSYTLACDEVSSLYCACNPQRTSLVSLSLSPEIWWYSTVLHLGWQGSTLSYTAYNVKTWWVQLSLREWGQSSRHLSWRVFCQSIRHFLWKKKVQVNFEPPLYISRAP
jgi:hypothetical protein